MDLQQKSSVQVRMCRFETREGLYEVVPCVCVIQKHPTQTEFVCLWHRSLGHASNKMLQMSAHYMKVIEITNFQNMDGYKAF